MEFIEGTNTLQNYIADSVKAIAQAEGYSDRQGATTLKDMLDLGILAKAVEGRNTFYALKGYEDVPF